MEDLRRAYEASYLSWAPAGTTSRALPAGCMVGNACLRAASSSFGHTSALATLAQPMSICCLSMLGEQQKLLLAAVYQAALLCSVPSYKQGPGQSCWCSAWLGSSSHLQNAAELQCGVQAVPAAQQSKGATVALVLGWLLAKHCQPPPA